MYTLLRQRRLRWLGHFRRMEDGRIPKDILYGELAFGRGTSGRPHLRYKYVCVRDLKAVDINTEYSKTTPQDRGRQTNNYRSGQARAAAPSDPKLHIDVSSTKIATPILGFSAINDAATTQREINKIKNPQKKKKKKKIRVYHPWSSLTDRSYHRRWFIQMNTCAATRFSR